jgi:hypothetical protein
MVQGWHCLQTETDLAVAYLTARTWATQQPAHQGESYHALGDLADPLAHYSDQVPCSSVASCQDDLPYSDVTGDLLGLTYCSELYYSEEYYLGRILHWVRVQLSWTFHPLLHGILVDLQAQIPYYPYQVHEALGSYQVLLEASYCHTVPSEDLLGIVQGTSYAVALQVVY